jgi:hypothetical protein
MTSECKLTDINAEGTAKVVPLGQRFDMFDKMNYGDIVSHNGRHFHIDEFSVSVLTYPHDTI